MVLFRQMMILLIIMCMGYMATRVGIVKKESNADMSSLVLNIANPAMIISAVAKKPEGVTLMEIGIVFLISFIMLIFLIGIGNPMASLIIKIKGDSDETGNGDLKSIYSAMIVFGNVGFIGLPVIQNAYGNKALFLSSVFLLPYNLLIYTYGVRLIGGEKDGKISIKSAFLNSGVIACFISIALFLIRIRLPDVLSRSLYALGSITSPLSMIIIGISLVGVNIRSLFSNLRNLIFSLVRMILIPAAFILVLKFLHTDRLILEICSVMISVPVGSMNVMLAEEYDNHPENAAPCVALTTVLSIFTMPLVSLLV